jgi:hypothetical protein
MAMTARSSRWRTAATSRVARTFSRFAHVSHGSKRFSWQPDSVCTPYERASEPILSAIRRRTTSNPTQLVQHDRRAR